MCSLNLTQTNTFPDGSDNGYTCPDAIQLKGLVCHSNCVDLVA